MAGLAKFFTFSGRASRSEYWIYQVFLTIVWLALIAVSSFLFSLFPTQAKFVAGGYWLIHCVFLIGSWAVAVRRLHDRNRPAWHLLWIFVPLAGGIILLIWWCTKGMEGPNRFGPDPLEARAA
ncbi:MAG: hypothetical protein JWQ58_572 [Reyranella sp.]|nr:hypothetical protein [Reyranella sp.]